MIFFQKLRSVFNEFGPKGLLYLLTRALEGSPAGLHCYHLVAQPVPQAPLLPAGRGRSIEVRRLGRSDPALLCLPLTQSVLDRRFGQDAICLGAFKDGAVIGCLWLCIGPYQEDEVRCRFIPQPKGRAAWDFDVYLHPDHRLGLGFPRLWDEANRLLRERGVAWSMSRISTLNLKSLAAHRRLGARHLGMATFLCLGRVQLMVSSLAPYVHLSTGPGTAPSLSLRAPETAPTQAEQAALDA
jgi:hypothetical protein